MHKRLAMLVALVAALTVTMAGNATAITGNYQDDFEHDFVGLLVFYTTPDPVTGDPFSHRCSGSLLSDRRTVVTAGHCTEGVDEGRIYFQQEAAPNYDPNAFNGWGGDPTTGYPYTGGYTFHRADNYGFHDFEGFPENKDVGVVVLDAPYTTPSGRYGILPTVGAVDRYAAATSKKQDVRFTSSGYGLSAQKPVPVSFRERLTANAYLVNNTAPITDVQPEDHREPVAGQGRDVQRRLRRPDLLHRDRRHRRGDLVRQQRRLQGPGLLLPARPCSGPRLDPEPEPGRRRLTAAPRTRPALRAPAGSWRAEPSGRG